MSWSPGVGRYPLARRRRHSRWRAAGRWLQRLPHRRLIASVILVLALLGGAVAWRLRLPDPHGRFAVGLAALREGRFAEAQAALTAALPAEPMRADVALARIAIERGDDAGAEIALQRAAAAGMPVARLHSLWAATRLLGGDTDGARAEIAQAPAAYRTFTDRIAALAMVQDGDVAGAEALLAGVAARHPRDAAVWRDLGAVRLDGGEVAGATDAAARSLAIDPHAPATLTLQGRLVRLRYGPVASLPWFAAALARDPGFVPALAEQAATLADTGRSTEALAAARAALAARPEMAQPLYVMAVIAARADRPALARRLLQKIDTDAMPGAMLLDGWLDRAEGHPDLAIARWQQLLAAQPYNLVVRRLLAATLLGSGDAQGAFDAAAPLVARADADSYTLEVASRAAGSLGRLGDAASLHDRAIGDRRGPSGVFAENDDVGALSAQASASGGASDSVAVIRALLGKGQAAAAIARAQDLVRAAPQAAGARLVLGDALMLGGRAGDTATVYAAAANLAFDEPTALRLIDALGRAGRSRPAATALSLYLAQNPASLVARRIAGHWQVAAGEPGAARTLAGVAAVTGGGEAAVLADLAVALANAGERDRALRTVRAAYQLAPMRLDVIAAYAAVLAKRGDADGVAQLRAKARAIMRLPG